MISRVKKQLSRQLAKRILAEDGQCFRNSALALVALADASRAAGESDASLRYVEGYAYSNFFPMLHGWIEGRDSRGAFVIDVTPVWLEKSGKVQYYGGLRYTRDEVVKRIAAKRSKPLPWCGLDMIRPEMRPCYRAATKASIGPDRWEHYCKMMRWDPNEEG